MHTLPPTHLIQTPTNHLTFNPKKLSGATITLINNPIYHPYSLLLHLNYQPMHKLLNPNPKNIPSKPIKSLPPRLPHLTQALHQNYPRITIQQFKNLM
ncbi:lipoyl protein ligase domain-containing protein, partial [Staphylococcus aureus]|uniref:lipoyl protein ligase domain-containing protein n=1 Tax=Staphylococcus aureus TaxID=1280 RepID=UPI0037D995C3